MKHILWACDFYKDSLFAGQIAAEIARRIGASVHTIHIMRPPSHREKSMESWILRKKNLETRLESIASELSGNGIGVSYEIIESDGTGKAILDKAERLHADIIAMGRAGIPAEEDYAGSTVRQVLHGTRRPVLITRGMDMVPKIDRLLVTTDLSDASFVALDFALPLARAFSAPVHLLFVYEYVDIPPTDEEMDKAIDDLRFALKARELSEGEVKPEVISHPESGEGIAKYITANNIPLTVISSRGASGIERWLLGSTTERVIKMSLWPILVVKE
ncbi:MAG: universal stress protein [candidate division WOR-3 bacterium]